VDVLFETKFKDFSCDVLFLRKKGKEEREKKEEAGRGKSYLI
jgi:hypothetical protein